MQEPTRPAWMATLPAPPHAALSQAAFQCGQLAFALDNHALLPAILYRARLDAARRCAGVDGQAIDPWHLAALLAGLRLSLKTAHSIAERGAIVAAARHALEMHLWFVAPDFDQEGDIQRAAQAILGEKPDDGPFMRSGRAMHCWIDAGQPRQAMRAALARYWQQCGLFALPLPLTAAASLAADTPWARDEWLPVFLRSLAAEAADLVQLTRTLEHAWRTARHASAGRRKTSHASAAIDLLAAAPLLSAPALGLALGIAEKNARRLLDELHQGGVVLEVTRRDRRRLYALRTMEPLREAVDAPKRPEPGRGRGRPPVRIDANEQDEEVFVEQGWAAPRLPRVDFDYADLDEAIVELEATVKRTRVALALVGTKPA